MVRTQTPLIHSTFLTTNGLMISSCGPQWSMAMSTRNTYLVDTPGQFTREKIESQKDLDAFNYYIR